MLYVTSFLNNVFLNLIIVFYAINTPNCFEEGSISVISLGKIACFYTFSFAKFVMWQTFICMIRLFPSVFENDSKIDCCQD